MHLKVQRTHAHVDHTYIAHPSSPTKTCETLCTLQKPTRIMDNLDYILVTLDGEEPIEFECEEDGSFLLTSLEAVVGCDVTCLRYKNETTGNYRFVKVSNGKFLPPKDGWGLRLYYVSKKADACAVTAPAAVIQSVKEEASPMCEFS